MKIDIMKYTEKVSNKLNELLEKTYDAKEGFTLAAEKVDNPSVKSFLESKADQRKNFAGELRQEIMQYGELPDEDGSFAANAHRTWMNIKTALSSNNEERILEEVQFGEKASLDEYNDILNDDDCTFPTSTEALLKKQRSAIEAAINTAKRYEELVS